MYRPIPSIQHSLFCLYNEENNQVFKSEIYIATTFNQNAYLAIGGVSSDLDRAPGLYRNVRLASIYDELWSTYTSDS